ncbi:uncharacterized protein A1O5_07956 [Cladophialophora psammophila CBS 110553]|uniref:Uncharacterized protein n=1 Tax=Cladophialophora psammophila CBS 110553 TaxID=1182543 RepID=W9WWJ4_9EURO|nr:uncharacterized protein A1O5_07956 [Cladophialophora psammophila CBS 110553]EXJ69021.1 hypothetical protein A1O5_07956 [Cladophialophora psammophila CBS 110553]
MSGLDMNLYNAEDDGPCPSDFDKIDAPGGPPHPPSRLGHETFDVEDEPGAGVENVGAGSDGEWEVVPQDPDWDMVPHDKALHSRKTFEREAPPSADWVVCEKGRNGEVQMFEGSLSKHTDVSSASTENCDQKSVCLAEFHEGATTPTEMRLSAESDPEDASHIARERKSDPLLLESQTLPSSQASSGLVLSNQAPSRRSYERLRPEKKVRSRQLQSTPARAEARKDGSGNAPQSVPIRISTGHVARPNPNHNPNKNRPFSADEKELPFLAPKATPAAAQDSRRQRHRQIADQLRTQADQEHVALMAGQQRMDERLQRTECALPNRYGLPHEWSPHFD